MKLSTLPDGIPVLSDGHHRSPRRGACFMELASVLAGEKWSDHPPCTHPLLAELARQVNDRVDDEERQRLLPMVPSVVGRRGDERTWVVLAVTVADHVLLDVPERNQRVLTCGLIQAVDLCGDDPELAETKQRAETALSRVPGAVAWVDQLRLRSQIKAKGFSRHSAPTMVRHAVEGVVESGSADRYSRLRVLLQTGIAACPPPQPVDAVDRLPSSWVS